jgi:hypothetical protein
MHDNDGTRLSGWQAYKLGRHEIDGDGERLKQKP